MEQPLPEIMLDPRLVITCKTVLHCELDQRLVCVYNAVASGICTQEHSTLVLQSRGCPLKGLPSTPTLEAHRQRFLTNGWENAHALDLDTIYKHHIDPKDKHRC